MAGGKETSVEATQLLESVESFAFDDSDGVRRVVRVGDRVRSGSEVARRFPDWFAPIGLTPPTPRSAALSAARF